MIMGRDKSVRCSPIVENIGPHIRTNDTNNIQTPPKEHMPSLHARDRFICCSTMNVWWHSKFAHLERLISTHHWKFMAVFLLFGLCCLGLRISRVDTDFETLWIEESDRLVSEWRYLSAAFQRISNQAIYSQHSPYHNFDTQRSQAWLNSVWSSHMDSAVLGEGDFRGAGGSSTTATTTGLPGNEYMGTMETVLQMSANNRASNASDNGSGQILSREALLDHMNFLVKVRRLEVSVGSSKWSLKDLCQRATLPFGTAAHRLQGYLDMIIPCMIITPLDCFWEGAKVLGPEESISVPWFSDQTLIQWTNLDPIGLLEKLRREYGNRTHSEVDSLIKLFQAAGINHGYLNRSCLDPHDPACPVSAPNHNREPTNIAEILTGGCPGFASNLLHWPEEILVGNRVYNTTRPGRLGAINGTSHTLVAATALQSLILLRSPKDLYEAVRLRDPYTHEGWTLSDAQHVLDEWRRSLRSLIIEHNIGLPSSTIWSYYAFTYNSLSDLLYELTTHLSPVKILGTIVLILLYGIVSLFDWRDPVHSQCWFAFSGLFIILLSSVAGLGICCAIGIPLNVLTIQVIPFLLIGLGMDAVFMLTTCHHCCMARRRAIRSTDSKSFLTPWASVSSVSTCSSASSTSSASASSTMHRNRRFQAVSVFAEHGPHLLFSTVAIVGAFYSAAIIPVPLMRQFCLQAGTIVIFQSVGLFVLFPILFKFDRIRRNERRIDVLCCLQQPFTDQENGSYSTPNTAHICQPSSVPFSVKSTRSSSAQICVNKVRRSRSCTSNNNRHPFPSIQVNVINHLGAGGQVDRSGKENFELNELGMPTHATPSPHGPTIHTTVTVGGCSGATRKHRSELSTKAKELGCLSKFNPPDYQPCQLQQSNNLYNDDMVSHTPLLVRFAQRFALVLTRHWLIVSTICLLGLGAFTAIGLLANNSLTLGLDWPSLTSTDSIEHGFLINSEQAFGSHNFQLIARGTDLPGTRSQSTTNHQPNLHRRSPFDTQPSMGGLDGQPRKRPSSATVGLGIDFPMQQRQMITLYSNLEQLPGVMLSGRKFWLEAMHHWLRNVQDAFDSDRRSGRITNFGYWNASASQLGVLGLHLIVQTDRGVELDRITTGRLVHDGIVDPPAFYTLLRQWRVHDALNYSALACVIYPDPGAHHSYFQSTPVAYYGGDPIETRSGRSSDLHTLPPADPIEFVLTNFFTAGIRGISEQLELVKHVRRLTESSTAQGVPAFPIGTLFTFTEHYLYLVRETAVALGIFFGIIIVAALLIFSSPVTVFLLLLSSVGGLFSALCGLVMLDLQLNPISACILLFSAGFGCRASVGFLGSWPVSHFFRKFDRNHRHPTQVYDSVKPIHSIAKSVSLPLESVPSDSIVHDQSQSRRQIRSLFVHVLSNQFGSVLHATIGLLLAIALLPTVKVYFISRYFFSLVALVAVGCFLEAVFLIPSLGYLTYPVQQYFLNPVTRRRWTQKSTSIRSQSRSTALPHQTLLQPSNEKICSIAPNPVRSPALSHVSIPSKSTNSINQMTSHTPYSAPSQQIDDPTIAPPVPAPRTTSKQQTGVDYSYLVDLCQKSLTTQDAQTPEAAATALMVALAAATSRSPRSRPASLSTIPEEPSHSNSTASLACLVANNTNVNVNHKAGFDDPSTAGSSSSSDLNSQRTTSSLHQPPSVGLIEFTRLLGSNLELYSTILPKYTRTASRDWLSDPLAIRNLVTALRTNTSLDLYSPPPAYSATFEPPAPRSLYGPRSVGRDGTNFSQVRSHPIGPANLPYKQPNTEPIPSTSVHSSVHRQSTAPQSERDQIPEPFRFELHHHHYHHHLQGQTQLQKSPSTITSTYLGESQPNANRNRMNPPDPD